MSGKGSKSRPYSVDQKTFESNWDKIFGKKKKEPKIIDMPGTLGSAKVLFKDENKKEISR